jgi:predicted kinase
MTIYVPVGLPGCGKTTLYRGLVHRYPDVSHISPDSYLIDQSGRYRGGRERRKAAWRQALHKARAAAVQGESFYFDATHITVRSRQQILEIAADAGLECVAIWFETTLKVCMERNAQQAGDRRVPDATMSAMHKELESPTTGEGFDQVIKPSSTGEFTGQPPRSMPRHTGFMLA